MEAGEIFGAAAIVVTMIVLIAASVRDWKEREVPDAYWIALGIIGLAMFISFSVYQTGFRWEYVCLAAGTVMILLDIFLDREFNPLIFYIPMALLFVVPLYNNMSDDLFRAWASVPVCYLIYVGMYLFNIIRGGADVKCLVTLSVMFPIYPHFFGLPVISIPGNLLSQIFVCSITVLFIAAVLVIPIIIYFAARNARESGFSRRMFSGYRMDITDAMGSFVWPLEDIVNGELTPIRIPEEEETGNIYARLKEAGIESVWVTPMVPFIVLIAIAAAIVLFIGSPLFLIG